MSRFIERTSSVLDTYLGRCPKCAKTSFRFMAGAIFLALAASLLTKSPLPLIATRALAVGCAALWLAHLVAFAIRAARNRTNTKFTALRNPEGVAAPLNGRREFLFTLGKSFLFAMTATAFPVRRASAADCPCEDNYKCCWDYEGTSYVCAPLDANCCSSNNPWYCPNGHDCRGDHDCS